MNKSNILKKSYEIERLLKNKKSVGSKYYVIYYNENKSDEVHIAISASKKLGDAVDRNYEKRVIRELFRKQIDKLKGLDMIFVIKKNSLDLSFEEKEKQIKYLLKKIVIKGDKNNEK